MKQIFNNVPGGYRPPPLVYAPDPPAISKYDSVNSPWTKLTAAWWTARVPAGPRQSETAAVHLSGRFAVRPSGEPAPPFRCQND